MRRVWKRWQEYCYAAGTRVRRGPFHGLLAACPPNGVSRSVSKPLGVCCLLGFQDRPSLGLYGGNFQRRRYNRRLDPFPPPSPPASPAATPRSHSIDSSSPLSWRKRKKGAGSGREATRLMLMTESARLRREEGMGMGHRRTRRPGSCSSRAGTMVSSCRSKRSLAWQHV